MTPDALLVGVTASVALAVWRLAEPVGAWLQSIDLGLFIAGLS